MKTSTKRAVLQSNQKVFLFLKKTSNSGTATNVEEYVPVMVPIKRATENHLIDTPPSKESAVSINIIVIELLIDLERVCVTALLTTSTGFAFGLCFKDSRILSKTTIVS